VAQNEEDLCEFLQGTFSAERELERNAAQREVWALAVSKSIHGLQDWGLIT